MAAKKHVKHDKKEFNMRQIIIIILLLLLLAAVIFMVVLLLRDKPQEDFDAEPGTRGTIVTQSNAEELILNDEAVPDGYYDVSMSIVWHFKDGVTEDAKVANKTTNTRTVYFDLLTTDEELMYSSPYIPVGESMQGFTLDKELAPGTYDMIVRYYLVDDDGMEVSNVSVGITVYVE